MTAWFWLRIASPSSWYSGFKGGQGIAQTKNQGRQSTFTRVIDSDPSWNRPRSHTPIGAKTPVFPDCTVPCPPLNWEGRRAPDGAYCEGPTLHLATGWRLPDNSPVFMFARPT